MESKSFVDRLKTTKFKNFLTLIIALFILAMDFLWGKVVEKVEEVKEFSHGKICSYYETGNNKLN